MRARLGWVGLPCRIGKLETTLPKTEKAEVYLKRKAKVRQY
jgi:hypothetical protein